MTCWYAWNSQVSFGCELPRGISVGPPIVTPCGSGDVGFTVAEWNAPWSDGASRSGIGGGTKARQTARERRREKSM